jgi:hypothetical protein
MSLCQTKGVHEIIMDCGCSFVTDFHAINQGNARAEYIIEYCFELFVMEEKA